MKLYFVRHGETEWNRKGKIQGQADIPLNPRGRREAERAAEYLKKIPFDAAFSSPLVRAVETGTILLGGRICELRQNDLLKEIAYGVREGQSLRLIHGWPLCRLHAYFHRPERFIPPRGGESIGELKERCGKFLREWILPLEQEKGHVLVTAHGALIRGMISVIDRLPDRDFWKGREQKNCSVTLVECIRGQLRVIRDAADAREIE